MATTASVRQKCSKCNSLGWVYPCVGCGILFCPQHAIDHRNELKTELENLLKRNDDLQNLYTQHEKYQECPLFSQIDAWEHDTISLIQRTAQTVRENLQQFIKEANNQMKTLFIQFNNELSTHRENDYFAETELKKWNEDLIHIRKQSETPIDIELTSDENLSPIHLIKVHVRKQNSTSEVSSTPLENQSRSIDQPQPAFFDSNADSIEEDTSIQKTIETSNENLCSTSDKFLSTVDYSLDPKQKNDILFFQSSDISSKLPLMFEKIAGRKMEISLQKDDCLSQLKSSEQATIFVDINDMSFPEQCSLFDDISKLANVYFIYIRGSLPPGENERSRLFEYYPKIKEVFENEQRLIVQWALNTVNEYKNTGDQYIKSDDKTNGRFCFEQAIVLYKNLSKYLEEQRSIH